MNNIRQLHDSIKNHDFWLEFDPSFGKDLGRKFISLIEILKPICKSIGKTLDGKDIFTLKYSPILSRYINDVEKLSCVLLDMKPTTELDKDTLVEFITYLQTFLMCVHQMVDEVEEPFGCYEIKDYCHCYIKSKHIGEGWVESLEIPVSQKSQMIKYWESIKKNSHFPDDIQKEIDIIVNEDKKYYNFI